MGLTRRSNFSSAPRRPVRLVAAVIWILALVLMGALVWAGNETRLLRAEARKLEDHRVRLTEDVAALEVLAVDAPEAEMIAAQATAVAQMNSLTGPRRASLQDILSLLEAEISRQVRVAQLNYNVETGRLNLSLQALKEAELPLALRQLEAIDGLSNVILERQLRLQQGSQTLVQYDIEAEAL